MSEASPGFQLLDLCAHAERELVLCAPFVKAGVVSALLDRVAADVAVELFTRWRAEEVAAGVSDLAVLELIEAKGGAVLLCDRLHAKYVRGDRRAALVGSANLTAAALGWSATPNLELQVEAPADSEKLAEFERTLREESVPATTELARQIQSAADLIPQPPKLEPVPEDDVDLADPAPATTRPWYPTLREPADLYVAYSEGADRLSGASARAASTDLRALEIPPGLDRPGFDGLVASRLRQLALFERLGRYLSEPRRFGEVRDYLAGALELERDDAERAWQTLMRWLLHFLPAEYSRRVPSHTEVLVRSTPVGSPP